MEKIKINGKEIEFDEKDLKSLSDKELEAAAGGFILPEGGTVILYRYECWRCGARGPWFTYEDKNNPEVCNVQHENPTCKGQITCQPHTGSMPF